MTPEKRAKRAALARMIRTMRRRAAVEALRHIEAGKLPDDPHPSFGRMQTYAGSVLARFGDGRTE